MLEAVIKQAGIPASKVDDVVIGNVLQPGAGAHTSRMAMFLAGYPATTTL